ncbi:MAG: outer membrane beta-barrel protein [Gammaproteobacteria bacterium]|nr:outer membrane beta-barrel protein [Gammaproteobacteria bacterium]
MKRIYLSVAAISLFAFSSHALAVDCLPYIGGGLGVGRINTPNKNVFNVSEDPAGTASHTQQGLSGRVFAGMNFIPYFGMEIGYTRYARSYYNATLPEFSENSSLAYYVHSYDVVAKGYLPLARSGFTVYILGGASRVAETIKFHDEGIPLNGQIAQAGDGSNHVYKTMPIYGAGMMYDFGYNFSANVEFTQVHSAGNISSDSDAVPNLNLATLNLAYHFG